MAKCLARPVREDGCCPPAAAKATASPPGYKELIVGTWSMSQGGHEASIEFKGDGTSAISAGPQAIEAT